MKGQGVVRYVVVRNAKQEIDYVRRVRIKHLKAWKAKRTRWEKKYRRRTVWSVKPSMVAVPAVPIPEKKTYHAKKSYNPSPAQFFSYEIKADGLSGQEKEWGKVVDRFEEYMDLAGFPVYYCRTDEFGVGKFENVGIQVIIRGKDRTRDLGQYLRRACEDYGWKK